MDDIDKYRIDLLRDAQKDVTDTIRALDRKISFIMTLKTFVITMSASATLYMLKNKLWDEHSLYMLLSSIVIFGLISLYLSIWQLEPKTNPLNTFIPFSPDYKYGNNTLFVFTNPSITGSVPKINLNNLVNNLNTYTEDIEKMKRLICKEIVKLSYIRDLKVKRMKLDKSLVVYFFTIIVVFNIGAYYAL